MILQANDRIKFSNIDHSPVMPHGLQTHKCSWWCRFKRCPKAKLFELDAQVLFEANAILIRILTEKDCLTPALEEQLQRGLYLHHDYYFKGKNYPK